MTQPVQKCEAFGAGVKADFWRRNDSPARRTPLAIEVTGILEGGLCPPSYPTIGDWWAQPTPQDRLHNPDPCMVKEVFGMTTAF